ncbi:hypothetical protein Tco_0496135 [Tanacetum coccineum]
MSIGGLSIPIGVELVLDSLYLDLHPEVGSIEAFCSSGGLVEGLSCSSRDLRPRLPDPNFRMINLPAGDTTIGIYSRIFDSSGVRIPFSSFLLAVLKYFKVHISQLVPLGLSKVITFEVLCRSLNIEPTVTLFRVFQTLSKQGDWFSFAKRGDPAPVCMEVAKSGLKLWKEKFFLIERKAIPFHMPWRHPDSCITDKVPTNFNQNHVDQLKDHIVKLRDILEGVLVRSGLSRVWRNPMCDPVLRRSDNTIMSIHDFLCMPSLDKATVREEPHGLDTSILGIVADRTTSPAPAGTVIPRASLISVTRPNPKVVTKADHATKRKTSTGPKISTNAAKKTRSSQKVSGAGSSGLAAGDGVEQTDDGTLDDDGQRDGSEFAMEDIGNLNDVSQDVTYPPILLPNKEVEAHAELSGGVRRTTRASFNASHGVSEDVSSPAQEAMPAPDTQPLDADAGADEIASDGNVDPYYEARVSNTAGDVLERDLFPFVLGPYYIPYPYDEGSRKLYMDPKVCRTALDRFTAPAETYRLRELSSVELSDRMSTQTIKKQRADLKQQSESTVRANEEVSRLKAELGALKFKCKATEQKLSSWDKKHRKYRNERDALAIEKEKIEEELAGTKLQLEHRERQAGEIQDSIASFFQSDFTPLVWNFLKSGEFNQAFAGVLNTAINVGVEHRLRMDRTDEEFRGLSQKVDGFIPDAKVKFDRVIATFPNTTFPFLDKTSSAAASLRANTHIRHSTSSSGTFGHTSTPEHLKKKKKFVEKGGPSAA